MFIIYSLALESLDISFHGYCETRSEIGELMDSVAKKFIRLEEGDKRATDPYKDDVEDKEITEDGYFLRHTDAKRIDVFLRKTVVFTGRLVNTCSIDVKKVMYFSVAEADFKPL